MMAEILYVSILYWLGIALLFFWLNRRLARVREGLAALEKHGAGPEDHP